MITDILQMSELPLVNQLTQNLNLNGYLAYYSDTMEWQDFLIEKNTLMSKENLSQLAVLLAEKLGATVLNIASQDFQPVGASTSLLIANTLAHLDSSHISFHSYLSQVENSAIQICRLDIDISTCGETDTLIILEDILAKFSFDFFSVDYKVRGISQQKAESFYFGGSPISIKDYIQQQCLDYDIQIEQTNLVSRSLYSVLVKKSLNTRNMTAKAKVVRRLIKGLTTDSAK